MRRMIHAIIGAAVIASITAGVVLALNYEGEDFCQHAPAWPGGTYLGQMHPFHSDFYRGYAERRGWDPCTTWAVDQQKSAIRGLRELGYTVTAPGELPVSGNEITLEGSGTTTRNITLTDGLWTVAYSVTGNRGQPRQWRNELHRRNRGGGGRLGVDCERDRYGSEREDDHARRF